MTEDEMWMQSPQEERKQYEINIMWAVWWLLKKGAVAIVIILIIGAALTALGL